MENDPLKIDARRVKIREILAHEGRVRVAQLSKLLDTSEVTIRNDLSELAKDGYLERVAGGAVLTMKNYYNMDFQQRKRERAAEKQAVATAIARLIEDGDTLFVNSGTTSFYAAMALKRHKSLNIVTNSVYVATELGDIPSFRIILLGGEINAQYFFLYGSDAMAQMAKYKADKAILSVDGASADAGITTYHPEETAINRLMLEQSGKTIIAADHTKIGYASFSRIAEMKEIGVCVTNSGADPVALERIAELNVEVVLC